MFELDSRIIKINDNDMAPYLQVGDLIRFKPTQDDLFELGDIIVFKHPRFEKQLVHRVISKGFKGDNLNYIDPPFDIEVLGKVTHRVISVNDINLKLISLDFKLQKSVLAFISQYSLNIRPLRWGTSIFGRVFRFIDYVYAINL